MNIMDDRTKNTEADTYNAEGSHECQCQDHDCANVVWCPRPAVCGSGRYKDHLCNQCVTDCAPCPFARNIDHLNR